MFWGLEWWAVRMATVGAAIGTIVVIVIGRALESLVHGVSVRDPIALAVGPALVVSVAALAAALPARRAAAVPATEALRQE